MIKKLSLASFFLSLIYALYKIPSYDNPISDSIFEIIGWFIPIFILLFILTWVVNKSAKVNMPFEKAQSLIEKFFYLQIILWSLMLYSFIMMWIGGKTWGANTALYIAALYAPYGIFGSLTTIILNIIGLKLLKNHSKPGWYFMFFTGFASYIIPPYILPLFIYWFLLKYRKEYFGTNISIKNE